MPDLVESFVPVLEARRAIRKSRGRAFYLHVKQFAHAIDQAGAEPDTVIGRDVSACARVSKREALGYLDSAYGRIVSTHHVRTSVNDRCFFIG